MTRLRHHLLSLAVTCGIACLVVATSHAAAADGISVSPAFQSVELAAGATARITLSVQGGAEADTIISIDTDCRCLHVVTPLPRPLPPRQSTRVILQATGVQSGVERVVMRTTRATVQADVQVVTNGLGRGRDVLAAALKRAASDRDMAWLVVHDLRGQVRNCGCTNGALGGIDILAALPAACRELAPGVAVTCILTGDADGHQPGVGAALAQAGWRRDGAESPALRVADDPAPFLTAPGITAVVTTGTSALNHRRIVRPVADGGMTAILLRVDGRGEIAEQVVIPIDRTLPADASILGRFPERLTATVGPPASQLANACAPCHQSAVATWNRSRHAHAWESLKPADRVDGCVSCHSTPTASASAETQPPPTATIAPGISCQSCHQGTEAHRLNGGLVPTTGATSCLSCHAPRHDPGFTREKAWQAILHGKEVAK